MSDRLGRVRIHWRDVRDGKEGVWEEEPCEHGSVWWDADDMAWCLYMWNDGNFSCDHNRIPLFLGDESWDEPDCTEYLEIVSLEVQEDGTDTWVMTDYKEVE